MPCAEGALECGASAPLWFDPPSRVKVKAAKHRRVLKCGVFAPPGFVLPGAA